MRPPVIERVPQGGATTPDHGLAAAVERSARRLEAALGRPRLLVAVLALYLPFFVVYFRSSIGFSLRHAASGCGGQPVLDQRWSYTPAQVADYLHGCGVAGRAAIAAQQDADLLYPALFGAALTVSSALLLRVVLRNRHWAHALVFLPMITAAADYVENIGIRVLLAAYPKQPGIVSELSAVTTVKLATGWASIAVLVAVAATAGIRRLRAKVTSHRS